MYAIRQTENACAGYGILEHGTLKLTFYFATLLVNLKPEPNITRILPGQPRMLAESFSQHRTLSIEPRP